MGLSVSSPASASSNVSQTDFGRRVGCGHFPEAPLRITAEYLWIDGTEPTRKLRSKTKVINPTPNGIVQEAYERYKSAGGTGDVRVTPTLNLSEFPEWGFDGSSTNQASGHDSDCVLRPVAVVKDPIRKNEVFTYNIGGISITTETPNYLVLCEVFMPDGVTPHPTNTRAELRRVLDAGAAKQEPWFGIEQEYALFNAEDRTPLGNLLTPAGDNVAQGPFYCSVGARVNFGRELVEKHTQACLDAGIMIEGTNFEVAPGQCEVQIGAADPLEVSDHLWLARWLLHRIGEDLGISISLDAKPFGSEFNGSGAHCNFSTRLTREHNLRVYNTVDGVDVEVPTGMAAITALCEKLGTKTAEHIAVYGHGIEDRLTGIHETCSYKEFRYGVADRGASIRIPRHVANKGYGYLEDRRPCANIDPYEVTARILKTICEIE